MTPPCRQVSKPAITEKIPIGLQTNHNCTLKRYQMIPGNRLMAMGAERSRNGKAPRPEKPGRGQYAFP